MIENLKPSDLNCNIFSAYDYPGMTIQELLCQFFTKINECVNQCNDTNELAEWLVNEGLSLEVTKKLVEWLNDGTLENLINVTLFEGLNNKIDGINSQLDDIQNLEINVKNFGAIGNGLDDDSLAFEKAFNKANFYNSKVFIPPGKYLLKTNKIYNATSLIGGYNTEIIVNANVRFDFTNCTSSKIEIKNLCINTNLYSTVDVKNNFNLFYDDALSPREYDINNIEFFSNSKNDYELRRLDTLFRLNIIKNSTISNIKASDVGIVVRCTTGSDNVDIRNIYATNTETIFYANISASNLNFDNLTLENKTPLQRFNWINKNNNSDLNGKDVIMIENIDYQAKNVKMNNIVGIGCCERVIYCMASNVKAYNLYGENTGGFKFVGSRGDDTKITNENINVENCILKLTNSEMYGTNNNVQIAQCYNSKNVRFKNWLLESRLDLGVEFNQIIAIGNHLEDVTFEDFTFRNVVTNGNGVFNLNVKDGKEFNGFYLKNFTFENFGKLTSGYNSLLFTSYSTTGIGTVKNVYIDNISVNNNSLISPISNLFNASKTGNALNDVEIKNINVNNVYNPLLFSESTSSDYIKLKYEFKNYNNIASKLFLEWSDGIRLPLGVCEKIKADITFNAEEPYKIIKIEGEKATNIESCVKQYVYDKTLTNNAELITIVDISNGYYSINLYCGSKICSITSINGVLTIDNTNDSNYFNVNTSVGSKFNILTVTKNNRKLLYLRNLLTDVDIKIIVKKL